MPLRVSAVKSCNIVYQKILHYIKKQITFEQSNYFEHCDGKNCQRSRGSSQTLLQATRLRQKNPEDAHKLATK